jgi:hypothetical protein
VAKIEDDFPSFENLDNLDALSLPGDEPAKLEPTADPEVVAVGEVEPIALATPSEVEAAKLTEPPTKEPEPEKEIGEPERKFEKKGQSPALLPLAAGVGVIVVLLGLALLKFVLFSTAVYLIALGCIPLGLWASRKTNTVFIVILGCILAAILTACFCLWREMGSYKFDVKAQDAKRITMMYDLPSPRCSLPA